MNGDVIRSLSYFKLLLMKISSALNQLVIWQIFLAYSANSALFNDFRPFPNNKTRLAATKTNENSVQKNEELLLIPINARLSTLFKYVSLSRTETKVNNMLNFFPLILICWFREDIMPEQI